MLISTGATFNTALVCAKGEFSWLRWWGSFCGSSFEIWDELKVCVRENEQSIQTSSQHFTFKFLHIKSDLLGKALYFLSFSSMVASYQEFPLGRACG